MSVSKRVTGWIGIALVSLLLCTQQQRNAVCPAQATAAPSATCLYDKIIQEYTVIWNALAYIMPPISNITTEECTAGSHIYSYHYTSKQLHHIQRAHTLTRGTPHYNRQTVSFFKSQFKTPYYYYVYYLRKIVI